MLGRGRGDIGCHARRQGFQQGCKQGVLPVIFLQFDQGLRGASQVGEHDAGGDGVELVGSLRHNWGEMRSGAMDS